MRKLIPLAILGALLAAAIILPVTASASSPTCVIHAGVNPGGSPRTITIPGRSCDQFFRALDDYIASQTPPNAWAYTPSGQHVTPTSWTIYVNGKPVQQ